MERRIGELLPPPNLAKVIAKAKFTKRLADFCDFAEAYIQGPEFARIPAKYHKTPKHKVEAGLWCEILVGLDFFVRWKTTPPKEDVPENFPKGLAVLVEGSRQDVLSAITLARNQDWSKYVENEYLEAFGRCEGACAAQRLGHWPERGVPRIFTREDVEAGMDGCKNSVVGVVDYGHIYRTLLTLTTDSDR